MFIKRLFAKATLDLFKNTIKINTNSTKNRARTSKNPPSFDLAVPNWCQIDARGSQNRFLGDFRRCLGAQNELKITKISWKSEEIFEDVFACKFIVIFIGFGVPKYFENEHFFRFVWKYRFRKKHCFSLVKTLLFRFGATENRSKIDFKTRSKKTLSENRISSGFWVDFSKFWGTKVPPNILGNDSGKNIENQAPKGPEKHPPGERIFECTPPP